MIFVLASLISLSTFAEANRREAREKLAFSLITFLMCLLMYDYILSGIDFVAILFALVGVLVALVSKGHLARSFVLSAFASPVLLWLTSYKIILKFAASPSLGFLGHSVESIIITILLILSILPVFLINIVPFLVFRLSRVEYLMNSRLSAPGTALYWTNAIWIFAWQNVSNLASFTSLFETVAPRMVLLVLLLESGGLPSKIAIDRLGLGQVEHGRRPGEKRNLVGCVTGLPVDYSEPVGRCPTCGASDNYNYFIEWLNGHSNCPLCKTHMGRNDLVRD
jgi:hypothetical protein